MKVLFTLALVLIAFISYTFLRDTGPLPLEEEELKQVLSSQSSDKAALTESFGKILHEESVQQTEPVAPAVATSPTSVLLDNLSAQEIYLEFEEKQKIGRQSGTDYVREKMFSSNLNEDVQEELLEMLHQGSYDPEDFRYLTREILGRPSAVKATLFKKALIWHAEALDPLQQQILMREMLERTVDPEKRQMVMDLAEEMQMGQL